MGQFFIDYTEAMRKAREAGNSTKVPVVSASTGPNPRIDPTLTTRKEAEKLADPGNVLCASQSSAGKEQAYCGPTYP
jgi:hypothetical protein